MSNVSNSTKKPISKSAITAIVFAVISLVTVFGTRKHGNAILAICSAVFVALVAIVLSMYVH